ncbi:hypothetical protein HMPREF1576_00261 [Gardnerella pickettii JCP7719]|uniref:Uncharacterized protein n=1 Tax=Gardnerella pickettii JCP7719 TaxID=1261061 RepID=S4GXM2_9BIFI|nr:hypothetical protein HMPREF1576_00261 [Gardnerella pickettii JCP7719]
MFKIHSHLLVCILHQNNINMKQFFNDCCFVLGIVNDLSQLS